MGFTPTETHVVTSKVAFSAYWIPATIAESQCHLTPEVAVAAAATVVAAAAAVAVASTPAETTPMPLMPELSL